MKRTVRCLVWHEQDGSWLSLCVDLSLSARADNLAEAKRRLSQQIREYIDALYSTELPQPPWPRRWLVPVIFALAPTLRVKRYRETISLAMHGR